MERSSRRLPTSPGQSLRRLLNHLGSGFLRAGSFLKMRYVAACLPQQLSRVLTRTKLKAFREAVAEKDRDPNTVLLKSNKVSGAKISSLVALETRSH